MTALVTGGTRGIGLAISRHLARLGHPVAMAYLSNEEAARLAEKEVEGVVRTIKGDVSKQDDVLSIYRDAEELGPVSIIVHSAVIPLLTNVVDCPISSLDQSYEVGPRAFMLLCQEAATRMEPGGRIVAITSIGSTRYAAGYGAIGPAKAAMDLLTRSFAVELAPKGIRVNAVAPSTIDGDFVKTHPKGDRVRDMISKKTPTGSIGTEDEIARVVGFLCSPDAEFVVGQTIVADGGLTLPL